MTRLLLLFFVLVAPTLAHAQKGPVESFPLAQYPIYRGPDLGLTFDRAGRGTLRVWAPTAEALRLRLYAAVLLASTFTQTKPAGWARP